MNDPLIENPGVKTLLSELLDSRRSKFKYVDRTRHGALKSGSVILFLLNSIASCLGIPVLFFVSFHALRIYLNLPLAATELLSILFYCITLSLLTDFLIGYLYDKLIKRGLYPVKAALNIVGTVGLVVAMTFLFQVDVTGPEALVQFRWTILVITVTYTMSNINSFKNAAQFTPSQDDRTSLMFGDYTLKGFFILLFVCLPYWIKFWSDDCKCGAVCSASPGDQACLGCLDNCDSFPTSLVFRDVTLAFTSFFGLVNIITEFLVYPRLNEEAEKIPTTFNRRLSEIFRNGLLVKSCVLVFLQSVALFGFAFWIDFFQDDRNPPTETCTRFWGTSAYFCSRGWMKTFTLLFFVAFPLVISFVANKKNVLKNLSFAFAGALIVSGILEIIIGLNQGVMYFFIAILMGLFYASFATNDVLYTNGIFYDEYMSGSTQAYLPSALYHSAVKCGFFIAAAFHITLYKSQGTDEDAALNVNSDGFGALSIALAALISVVVWFISKYDLHAFDKTQLAIERNDSDVVEGLTFYDPIDRKTIRRPVISHDSFERTLIMLLYNLDPRDDLNLAINGKHEQLQSNSMVRMVLFLVAIAIFTTITIVFAQYLDTRWGWLMLIGLLTLPLSLYGVLYNYNVWATGVALDSSKYKSADKSLLRRFVAHVDEKGGKPIDEVNI